MSCSTCQGPTSGYKCDQCGSEAAEHDEGHSCGGSHCMVKCEGCGEAEAKCTCE